MRFAPAILFLFGLRIIHSLGGEKCSLARDSEPIRLLKTPRSLSVYILNTFSINLLAFFHECHPLIGYATHIHAIEISSS